MESLREARCTSVDARGFTLDAGAGWSLSVAVVDDHTVRVLLSSRPSRPTWAVLPCPGAADVPKEGRERRELSGYPLPAGVRVDASPGDANTAILRTGALVVTATLRPCLSLSYATADGAVFAQDRLQRGYAAGPACAAGVAHAQRRAPGEQYFGLGDKGGPLDLAGRRLRCAMTDALGSDPASGDPGYKHWPFLLVRSSGRGFSGVSPPADGAIAIGGGRAVPSESPAEQQLPSPPPCYGMFYDVDDECVFDLGCEHSNYHGAYRLFEAPAAPELDLYVFLGPSLPAATSRFAKLTGMCPLPPRWALGYGATAMPLADDPRAAARIAAFADELADRGVPASSFHFGSGYTMTAAGLRLTFEWNAERYPDPAGLVRRLRGANRLRVVANVKPVLLLAHPRFAEAAAAGLLLRDGSPGGDPAKPRVSLFWDAEGAGLDFQNPAAAAWWRARATASLLGVGVDALWNDNNEVEVEGAALSLGSPDELGGGALQPLRRPLQPLLMARASWEATAAACAAAPASPARRPFCVTRAASPGAQRYASSWTGDNASSWHSLRWGLSAVLQLSLSGLFFVGADVGGFSGPPPPPELLVRWFQAGCLHPRFVTNSWKACGSVTSPLLHPASVALCVAAIRLRLRLMPYLYSLCAAAAERGEPIVRPPFWDFGAADPACFAAAGHARPDGAPACFMLGPSLLAAPAVDPGARSVTLRLPAGPAAWYDWYSEESLAAGAVATLGAPLDRLPLACPAGAMLPLTQPSSPSPTNSGGCTAPPPAVAPHDEPTRHLRVFPFPASGASAFTLVEDDGETAGGPGRRLRFALTCTPHEVAVTLEVEHVAGTAGGGDYALPYDEVVVSLPAAERRPLRLAGPAGGPRLVRGRFAHEPL